MHASLHHCPHCDSFTPKHLEHCVQCDLKINHTAKQASKGSWTSRIQNLPTPMKLGGMALVSMSLTACYGAPMEDRLYYTGGDEPNYEEPAGSINESDLGVTEIQDAALPDIVETCSDPSLDLDEDGYCGEFDCDESDPFVHDQCSDPMMDSGGMQAGAEAAGEQSAGEQSAGEQSAGEQSAGEQSAGEQSAGEQSAGEQSAGEQSAGEQSAGNNG